MNIYQSLYDLLNQYIFGNSVVAGTHQDLVCVLLSTFGVLFCFAVPFMLVYKIIKMI